MGVGVGVGGGAVGVGVGGGWRRGWRRRWSGWRRGWRWRRSGRRSGRWRRSYRCHRRGAVLIGQWAVATGVARQNAIVVGRAIAQLFVREARGVGRPHQRQSVGSGARMHLVTRRARDRRPGQIDARVARYGLQTGRSRWHRGRGGHGLHVVQENRAVDVGEADEPDFVSARSEGKGRTGHLLIARIGVVILGQRVEGDAIDLDGVIVSQATTRRRLEP